MQRDAPDISGLRRLADLPLLLRLLTARNASELNLAGIASDSGIPSVPSSRTWICSRRSS